MANILLIDADIIIYQQACANQEDIDWGDGQTSSVTSEELAQQAVKDYVQWLEQELNAKWSYMCLGTRRENNFRRKLNPEYKWNRENTTKPLMRYDLAGWVMDNFKTIKWPGVEGDDVMGIMSTGPMLLEHGSPVIVSIDKDMLQVPGRLYNPRKPDEGIIQISLEEADFAFFMQCLTGDSSDGYKGIPGVGPVKARKILEQAENGEPHEFWQLIVDAYEVKGMTEDDALMQARMARILRWEDYDYDNKEVKLWLP